MTLCCGQDERSVPAHESAAGSDIAQPLLSAYWPVPKVVLDIEAGAGGNELLDHARASLCCAQDERSVPSEKAGCCSKWQTTIAIGTMAGLDRAKPYPRHKVPTRRCPRTARPRPPWQAPAPSPCGLLLTQGAARSACTASTRPSRAGNLRSQALPRPVGNHSTTHSPTLGRLDRRRERKQYPPASVEWTSEPSASSAFTPPASP